MKTRLLTLLVVLTFFSSAIAQVEVINGPGLTNDKDNKMNRLLQGDDDSFYTYRVRSKGKGTSFYVEKYDKATLKPIFSKEIGVEEDADKAKIEDVEYAQGKVFIFRRKYDKNADKMTLYFQTVTSDGDVATQLTEITAVTSDHYQFVDFDIFLNPAATKFIIKSSHKANKEDAFKTDFILMDASSYELLWTKTVDRELFSNSDSKGSTVAVAAALGGGLGAAIANKAHKEDIGFIGLLFDDQDNIYYGYTEEAKTSTEKESRYTLSVGVIKPKSDEPEIIELKFEKDYYVKDIEFSKTNSDQIVIGGFVKDVIERKGRDLVDVGVFQFTVNLADNSVKSNTVVIFDKEMLTSLESNPKLSRYFKYKLDYIMPIGENVYFVGEQYQEQMITNTNSTTHQTTTSWRYEYMDVIVAKLNSKGEFEWIKNTPLRNNMSLKSPHVFKQYIAFPGKDDIYIMANEHPKNMAIYSSPTYKPSALKSVTGIHKSSFVCSQISLTNGEIKHYKVFDNIDYCFAPIQERNPHFMPPSDTEIFVSDNGDEIYIYTEDRGADRFSRITY